MNKNTLTIFLPAIIVFIVISSFLVVMQEIVIGWGFDPDMMLITNLGLFFISLVSFLMGANGLRSKDNSTFFKMVYGSFFIKLVLIAGAAFGYIMWAKEEVNKPSIFASLGLYVIYTFFEVAGLMKLAKRKINA